MVNLLTLPLPIHVYTVMGAPDKKKDKQNARQVGRGKVEKA